MRSLFYSLIASLVLLANGGCSSAEKGRLAVEPEVCTLSEGQNTAITIKYGNGDYTVSSEDEQVVLAGFCRVGKTPGNLLLTGINPGETWVSLTDNLSGEQVKLKVRVQKDESAD